MPNTFFIKTTSEWDSTSMNSYIIPRGDLCIEAFDDGDMKLKIGDGSRVFKQLPYICHCHDEDFYTKEEIDKMIDDITIDLNNYYNKTEIDKLLSSLKEELIKYINDHTHSHDNKDILDQITAPFTIEEKEKIKDIIDVSGYDKRIKALEADSHTHDNKDILDSITTKDVNSWHTHANKSVLDNTTASFTVNYKSILDNMKTYKVFEPASAYESGSVGLVPAPNRGDNTKFLRGDGKWVYVEGGGGGQLEPATRTTLGGVIIGNGINVDANGLISIEEIEPYELPVATSNTLGGVKIGENIDINNGVISVTFPDIPEPYILPKATSSNLGGVIVGDNIDVDDGIISVTFPTDAQTVNGHTVEIDVPADAKFTDTIYELPVATSDVLGGVKIGDRLSITEDGVLSADEITVGVLSVTQDQSNLSELIVEYEDHSDRLVIPNTEYLEGTAIDIITSQDPISNSINVLYSTGLSVNADNELINTGVLDIQESTNPLEIIKVTESSESPIHINLPIAGSDTLGGVKVGDGLSIDNTGVLSANVQENGVLDVSVNVEDPYKLDIVFSDHTKSIELPDPVDVGVIDVRAQQDETVSVLEVEKTSGVSEIDLIALLQGLTINVNFSDDGSVINRAIINKHAYERINVTEIISSDDVINNEHVSERANLSLTTNNVITNMHAVIPDES